MVDETTNDLTPADPSSVPDDSQAPASPLTQAAKPTPFTSAPEPKTAKTPTPASNLPKGTGTKFGTPAPTGEPVQTEEEKQKAAVQDTYNNMAADALDLHHGDVAAAKAFVASGNLPQEHKAAILNALDNPSSLPARSHVTINKDTLHNLVAGPDTVVGGTKKELEHPTEATGGDNIKASVIEATGLPGVASMFTDKAVRDASGTSPLSRAIAKNTNKPAVDLKAVLPADNTAGTALERGVLSGVSGLTSPENLALIASMEGAPAAAGRLASSLKNIASTGFTIQMAHDLYQTAPELKHAVDDGDFNKAAELLGHMIPTAIFTGEGLKHLYEGGVKPLTDPEFLANARGAGAEKRGQKLEDARAQRQADRVAAAKKGDILDVTPIAAESATPANSSAQQALPPAPPHITFDSIGGTEVKAPEPATRPSELSPNREVMVQNQAGGAGQGEQTGDLPALHPEEHAELEAQAGRPLTTAEAANFRNNQLITQTNRGMAGTGEGTRDEITNAREPHRAELEQPVGASVSPNLESRKTPDHEIKPEGPEWERTYNIVVDGQKVGSVMVKTDPSGTAQLAGAVVDSSHRGQGLAQSAYRSAIAEAQASGATRITSDSTHVSPDANRVWEALKAKGLPVENITHPNGTKGYQIDFENPAEASPTYHYHSTLATNIPAIAKEGLTPNLGRETNWGRDLGQNSKNRLFLSGSPENAKFYGNVVFRQNLENNGQSSIPVVLRIKNAEGVSQENTRSAKLDQEFTTNKAVPPKNLEVYWHGEWQPLNKVKNIIDEHTMVSHDEDLGEYTDEHGESHGTSPQEAANATNEYTLPATFQDAAKTAGVAFRGVQQGVGDKAIAVFQDPVSKTSFSVDTKDWSPEKFQQSLKAARDRMTPPEPKFEQALARRGEMPNQTVNLAPAYGPTGKYVGGHVESRLAGTPEEKRQQYIQNLGVTQGTTPMEIPAHLMTEGGSTEDALGHEIAHIIFADRTGIPTKGSFIQTHLHLETSSGAAAVTHLDDSLIPGTTSFPNGLVRFSQPALQEFWPKALKTYLAGVVSQEIVHGLPTETNDSGVGDKNRLHQLGAMLDFTPEEVDGMIAGATAQLKQEMAADPKLIQLIKTASSTREEGLSKTLHFSAERIQEILKQDREARNAGITQADDGRHGAVVSTTDAKAAGRNSQSDLREGDGQTVSPNRKEKVNAKDGDVARTGADIHRLGEQTQPGGESETAGGNLSRSGESSVATSAEARKVKPADKTEKPAWWNEPSDNRFAPGMTKGEEVTDWITRHKPASDFPSDLDVSSWKKDEDGDHRLELHKNGKLMGFIQYAADPIGGAAQIHNVYLDDSLRGKGLGTKLYERAFKHAATQGLMSVESDERELSPSAIKVWKGLKASGKYDIQKSKHEDGFPKFTAWLGKIKK